MNEAALAADSIAIPRDVNLAMELGFNYPEGPLATADYVGLRHHPKAAGRVLRAVGPIRTLRAQPLTQ